MDEVSEFLSNVASYIHQKEFPRKLLEEILTINIKEDHTWLLLLVFTFGYFLGIGKKAK